MDNMYNGSLVPRLLLIFFLILINAFFVAAEMSIVSLNKNKISLMAKKGNSNAILIKKLLKEPNSFLATIQIGITFAGFFASASAATSISSSFSIYLERFNIPYSPQIALISVTIIISYITLVFGELVPKKLALQKPETIAMISIKPISFISKTATPFVKFLSGSTNLACRVFGISSHNYSEKLSREEIQSIVLTGKEHGVINDIEEEMIHSIFEFDDTIAKEVMTPRTEVFALDIKNSPRDITYRVIEEKFSRVPIYEDSTDNIIGILYIKDLFENLVKLGIDNINILHIIKPPYFVPETKNIDTLFKELQETKNHLAILIDEYGGFSGVVSIEDLIEEVMGNIFDEYDELETQIKKIENNVYIIDGLLSIDDFNDYFHLKLNSDTADTIGGFLVDLLGSIPTANEKPSVEFSNMLFEVNKVDEKRIESIRLTLDYDNSHENEKE